MLKFLLIGLLLLVAFNLFHALYYMIKNDEHSPKMSKFLGRRLIFSALIVMCILVAMHFGLLVPNPTPH